MAKKKASTTTKAPAPSKAEKELESVKGAAYALLETIASKGLEVQVGQKEYRLLCEAVGVGYSVAGADFSPEQLQVAQDTRCAEYERLAKG